MKFLAVLGAFLVASAAQAALDRTCLFPCTYDYQPVCGNDLKTYPNECAMRGKACMNRTAIIAVYKGRCREEPNECNFPCTREYLPVCGSDGRKYATECTMRYAACKNRKAITVVNRFVFKHTDCGSNSACIIPCFRIYQPVCGSDRKTYSNECMMRGQACETNTAIIAVHDGKCHA